MIDCYLQPCRRNIVSRSKSEKKQSIFPPKSISIVLSVIVTKNRCVTHVKICEYANFVSSLLAYLISTVVS